MDLKEQVVSLELAIKMKELGFPQDSLWYWVGIKDSKNINFKGKERQWSLVYGIDNAEGYKNSYGDIKIISAYTESEVGEILPEGFEIHKTIVAPDNYSKNPVLDTSDYCIKYFGHIIYEITEANCRAKMAIYLKENKLI